MENDETNSTSMTKEILDKMAALITAAFGLVAALAWNDAIKAIFSQVFGPSNTVGPMLAYALIVSGCCNFDNSGLLKQPLRQNQLGDKRYLHVNYVIMNPLLNPKYLNTCSKNMLQAKTNSS